MRKYLVIVFVGLFALVVGSAYAEQGNNVELLDKYQDKKDEIRDKEVQLKDKKLGTAQDIKDKEASRRAEFNQKAREAVMRGLNNIRIHLYAYLDRLDKIAGKIETRIAKLKAMGVDTSIAERKLVESRLLREAAKTAVDKAAADIGGASSIADIKSSLQIMNGSIRLAKNALFAYHKGLVGAIRELKAARDLREATGSSQSE